MKVLVVGASGFIGRHVVAALEREGHQVFAASRHPRDVANPLPIDAARHLQAQDWLGVLRGMDVVINAVGIFREQGSQRFDTLHVQMPRALFAACVTAGVKRVLQISALGADDKADTAYHLSKRQADEELLGLPLSATVLRPSLVFGGTSSHMFSSWAALPIVPVPGQGLQQLQPVHVDDAVKAIVRCIADAASVGAVVPLVGPAPMTLRAYLAALRQALGLRPAWQWLVPMRLVRMSVAMLARWPGSLADADSLRMLERGNTSDAQPIERLLGHPPRPVPDFYGDHAAAWRTRSRAAWALPILRLSVALVWIVTGILSAGLFPVDQSLALLARLGAEGAFAKLLLYGASAMDLSLGIAVLFGARAGPLWLLQAMLILGYTALITWRLPEFWLHPFGPILKNLPILAALAVLWALEDKQR
jgi:uncharacterized protein YbjT (DUF2867 family)